MREVPVEEVVVISVPESPKIHGPHFNHGNVFTALLGALREDARRAAGLSARLRELRID